MSFLCYCLICRVGNINSGDRRFAKGFSSSEPGLTGTVRGKDVSKTLWYNGQWPPPLSMTCYQSSKGPSVTHLTCYAREPGRCTVCQLPTNPPPKAKTSSAVAIANWDGVQRYYESKSNSQLPPLYSHCFIHCCYINNETDSKTGTIWALMSIL